MSMRLGKEQSAGYVEDTENVSADEDLISLPERTPATPEPEPAVTAG
jgi:hypothetical protein